MFVVRCPNCKQTMRYDPSKEGPINEKKKKCVYCGKTFKIHTSVLNSRIVREEEPNTSSALFHSVSQIEEFKKKMN